jgi:hypothetical protein
MDYASFWIGVVTGIVLMTLLHMRRNSRLKRRAHLDRPPLPIAATNVPPDLRAPILKLKAEGRTVEAVKLMRDRTRCGLKEAKDAVDDLR